MTGHDRERLRGDARYVGMSEGLVEHRSRFVFEWGGCSAVGVDGEFYAFGGLNLLLELLEPESHLDIVHLALLAERWRLALVATVEICG